MHLARAPLRDNYVLLLAVFRMAGKRTLAHTTTFDLVLLLIISEAVSNGLTGSDYSITNAALIVVTLILADIGLSRMKRRSPHLEALIDGLPLERRELGHPPTPRERWSEALRHRRDAARRARSGRSAAGGPAFPRQHVAHATH